ncbi:hypothetical protein ACSNOH_24240 [Streptomyces sp. URMC 127]|uniref:hypothetical protein n=1 Tax=Streptomyces sp. URMC 127 TaxID=3423402 RepID=UPI003F1D7D6A
MSGQQQVEHGVAPVESSSARPDMSKWCLRCAELRLRFHGAVRLGRPADAVALNAEFARHQQLVHS